MSAAAIWRFLTVYGPTIAVAAVSIGGLYFAYDWAWQRGWDAREAEVIEDRRERQEQIHRLADRLSDAEAQKAALEEQLGSRAREIEDEVRADTDACRRVAPDSELRLERRWGVRPAD